VETTKVFMSGRSQAVRIPKKYRFQGSEVTIRKRGNELILSPLSSEERLQAFLAMPAIPDFKIERKNGQKVQQRELF
jgi:antitoxin VapB